MSQWITEEWLRQRVEGKNPIDVDRPCLHCGYNVRGLMMGQKCPECGEVISKAQVLIHMMDAPVSYLKSMRMGMWITALGIFAPFVGLVIGVPSMVEAGGFVIMAVGMWILTQPRPERRGIARRWYELAMIARGMTVLFAMVMVFQSAAEIFGGTFPLLFLRFTQLLFITEFVVVGLVLRDLAEWCQDHGLATGFKIVLWLLVVGYVLAHVMSSVSVFIGSVLVLPGRMMMLIGLLWFVVNVIRMAVLLTAAVHDKPRHDQSMNLYKKAL